VSFIVDPTVRQMVDMPWKEKKSEQFRWSTSIKWEVESNYSLVCLSNGVQGGVDWLVFDRVIAGFVMEG